MLSIQCIDQTGEVAHIVLESGRFELNISFKYGRIYIPAFNELVDILRREKIFVSFPIAFEGEDRFIDLGFNGDFDIDITSNRGQAGETIILDRIPIGLVWDVWENQRLLLEVLTLHFPQVALPPQEALI